MYKDENGVTWVTEDELRNLGRPKMRWLTILAFPLGMAFALGLNLLLNR